MRKLNLIIFFISWYICCTRKYKVYQGGYESIIDGGDNFYRKINKRGNRKRDRLFFRIVYNSKVRRMIVK